MFALNVSINVLTEQSDEESLNCDIDVSHSFDMNMSMGIWNFEQHLYYYHSLFYFLTCLLHPPDCHWQPCRHVPSLSQLLSALQWQ